MPEDYRDVAGIAAEEISNQAPRLTGALASSPEPGGSANQGHVLLPLVYSGVQNYGWPARGIKARRFVEKARDNAQRKITQRLTDGLQRVLDRVRGA